MASSDEDDLAALRLAALATLTKKKQEVQEPQGIQVLSSLSTPVNNQYQQASSPYQQGNNPYQQGSNPYNQPPNQYQQVPPNPYQQPPPIPYQQAPVNQYQRHGGMHPESYQGYQDYGEVPFAFQQAVLKQQQMRGGRGRGFQRGRGRGRGNRFPQKPVPQSALIVIQVEGGKEEQATAVKGKPKDSRPFLMRPQDKWASTEGSSQESTPTRPKDTSKFRRYDDETDSEEDEDVEKGEQSDSETLHFPLNMSLEEVSSDTEIELNKSNTDDAQIEVHNEIHNVEIHNEHESILDNNIETDKAISEDKTAASSVVKENNSRVPNGENLKEFQSEIKVGTCINASSARNKDNGATSGSSVSVGDSGNMYNTDDVRTVVKHKNIEAIGDTCNTFESDSTPLRDEGTPLQDEPRQDDSVSNSYVTFSRFNRRNRRDSGSGSEESEDDDDDAVLGRHSDHSHSDSEQESVNSDTKDGNNDITEPESEVEMKDDISLPPTRPATSPAKPTEHSQDTKSTVSSSAASRKSPVSSSSSESSSDSSSSSSESDSGASSASSARKKKSITITSHVNVIKKVKSETVISKEDIVKMHHSEKQGSHQKEKVVGRDRKDARASLENAKNRKDRKRSEGDQEEKKTQHERSSKYNDKKSHRDTYVDNQVKAAPEFDATNYRDKEVMQKGDKRQDRYDRKPRSCDRRSQEGSRSGWKRQGDSHSSVDRGKSSVDQGKTDRGAGGKDRRYFEEIGRLKMVEDQEKNRKKSDNIKTSKPKFIEDGKSNKSNITADNGAKKNVKLKESSERDSKTDLKKDKEYVRQSKSDNRVHNSKSAKTSRSANDVNESEKLLTKQRRKSGDSKSKNPGSASKKLKTVSKQSSRRKSLNDSWKRDSESDTESEKSISSLSDMSSDSETETWRDKKRGATRKTADIELEKRRRELKEREKRTENRNRDRNQGRGGRGDHEESRINRYRQRDDIRDRKGSPESNRGNFRKGSPESNRSNFRKGSPESNRTNFRNEDMKERRQNKDTTDYYRKPHNELRDDKPAVKNKFQELSSSDSEVDVKTQRGVVSVVKSDKAKVTSDIPSLLQISVTKPKSDNVTRTKKKSTKSKRLIIQVSKSSDEDSSKVQTKQKKKKRKDTKSWSSDEECDELPQKQVVNVTFNEESKREKAHMSVYDRLGIPVNKTKHRGESGSGDASYTKRSHEDKVSSVEKRVKLNEGGKYAAKHSKKQRDGEDYDQDSVLNQRIQKIKEKNAEILRRKQLVEQDKQIYG